MLLEQAKEHMDSTELKLLMLMLQMRGQFDRAGGLMVNKGAQTDGAVIINQAVVTSTHNQAVTSTRQMDKASLREQASAREILSHGSTTKGLAEDVHDRPRRSMFAETDYTHSMHHDTMRIVDPKFDSAENSQESPKHQRHQQ